MCLCILPFSFSDYNSVTQSKNTRQNKYDQEHGRSTSNRQSANDLLNGWIANAEVLKKIEDYSISNRAEFEALVKKNLAMQQTDQTKKQQKRIPQITTRLEQIDKVLNKLYEDNALGTISQDRYEQMSQKYSEEYYALKAELATLQEQLSAYENAGGRAQKFLKLTERHAAFTDLTPAILNEFISRIEVHERDQKKARYAIQHISIYFNYIGKFENEVTQLAEPTEQVRQLCAQSSFKSRVTPQDGDVFITLSTCSYEYENARYVVIGRVIEIMK